MTFQEFQNSRQWTDNLAKAAADDLLAGCGGWLYCEGQLWIEDTSSWPSESPGFGKGKWYTRIVDREYQSDSLVDCERPLFEFATSEQLIL
jgi:hypothetical protein